MTSSPIDVLLVSDCGDTYGTEQCNHAILLGLSQRGLRTAGAQPGPGNELTAHRESVGIASYFVDADEPWADLSAIASLHNHSAYRRLFAELTAPRLAAMTRQELRACWEYALSSDRVTIGNPFAGKDVGGKLKAKKRKVTLDPAEAGLLLRIFGAVLVVPSWRPSRSSGSSHQVGEKLRSPSA